MKLRLTNRRISVLFEHRLTLALYARRVDGLRMFFECRISRLHYALLNLCRDSRQGGISKRLVGSASTESFDRRRLGSVQLGFGVTCRGLKTTRHTNDRGGAFRKEPPTKTAHKLRRRAHASAEGCTQHHLRDDCTGILHRRSINGRPP